MRKADLLDIVEAAYDVRKGDQEWLEGVVNATHFAQDRGLGVFGFVYELSDSFDVRVQSFSGAHMAEHFDGTVLDQVFGHMDARVRRTTFERVSGTTSEFGGDLFALISQSESTRRAGIQDYLTVNCMDPTRIGCSLNVSLPAALRLTPSERSTWNRVATHISAGHRLRRHVGRNGETRLDPTRGADAILRPSGSVQHAEEPAQSREAREQ